MIIRSTAIPLSIHPYSSTSSIVHWLTRHHGKISTVLKGSMRPKSPFLGEFELFSTSELLFFMKHTNSLFTGKECSMLTRRSAFRTDWRAMQTASYLSALIDRTTPDDGHHPELFAFYEDLLDQCMEYGASSEFLIWAELQFCHHHGHAPHLATCVICDAKKELCFCAAQGGTVCRACAKQKTLATLPCPPDVLAILQAWKNAANPAPVVKTALNGSQRTALHSIAGTFMHYQFSLQSEFRNATMEAI